MKLLLRIQLNPSMNSDASSDSEHESSIHPLAYTIEGMIPIVNDLKADMGTLSAKLLEQSVTWLQTPVVPASLLLHELWVRYEIQNGSSIHTLLNIIFIKATALDLTTRTIYFSVADTKTFGAPSMSFFDLLHTVIDSVDFI